MILFWIWKDRSKKTMWIRLRWRNFRCRQLRQTMPELCTHNRSQLALFVQGSVCRYVGFYLPQFMRLVHDSLLEGIKSLMFYEVLMTVRFDPDMGLRRISFYVRDVRAVERCIREIWHSSSYLAPTLLHIPRSKSLSPHIPQRGSIFKRL